MFSALALVYVLTFSPFYARDHEPDPPTTVVITAENDAEAYAKAAAHLKEEFPPRGLYLPFYPQLSRGGRVIAGPTGDFRTFFELHMR